MMNEKRYLLTVLGGGAGFTLEDTDLWGMESVLHNAIQGHYVEGKNREWAESMLRKIGELRRPVQTGCDGNWIEEE